MLDLGDHCLVIEGAEITSEFGPCLDDDLVARRAPGGWRSPWPQPDSRLRCQLTQYSGCPGTYGILCHHCVSPKSTWY